MATTGGKGHGVADVHNLVTLSRFPIRAHREVRHELVTPLLHRVQTAMPPAVDAQPVRFDRPILVSEIELPGGDPLTVINLHLRAPLAASVAGQKLEPFVWKSVGGWAEGYFLSAVRRAAQALELRLLLEQLFDATPMGWSPLRGTSMRKITKFRCASSWAEENTGNPALSGRSLVLLDRALPEDRRWSVLHHGRTQMLDHILASRTLHGRFRAIEVHNETLSDELIGYARHTSASASSHAPVVAEFADRE